MLRTSRIVMMAAAVVFTAGSAASANTVELTLTVPIKLTLGSATSAAMKAAMNPAGRGVKPFDVNCVVGANLGYATGSGAQGQIVGQGGTATSGTRPVMANADGTPILSGSPTAKVIITYDDGLSGTGGAAVGAGKGPNAYLCWVQWTTPIPSLAPIFVQGTLQ
jgi:hypothetical protein